MRRATGRFSLSAPHRGKRDCMRKAFSSLAALALAAAPVSIAAGATAKPMAAPMSMKYGTMPKCTAKSGPVVWYVAAAKRYYMKGSEPYGKGSGKYVCRTTAAAGGAKAGAAGHTGTAGTGAAMGSPSSPMTMAPRPMSSSLPNTNSPGNPMTSPMPGNTAGPGLPGSTNAAPGSRGSPMPAPSGMGSGSGNQGNTGAPGAGGQVPNNPASSTNSTTPGPSPSPSMRP